MISLFPPKAKTRCPHCQQEMPAGKPSSNASKHSMREDDTRQIVQEEIQQVLEAATQQVVAKAMESILPVLEKVQLAIGQMHQEALGSEKSSGPSASNPDFSEIQAALADKATRSLNDQVARRTSRFLRNRL